MNILFVLILDDMWMWTLEKIRQTCTTSYQAKATTLTCVLVRMVALVLIFEYHFLHTSPCYTINHKYKATNIYEYFTPYACPMSPSSNIQLKLKVLNLSIKGHSSPIHT